MKISKENLVQMIITLTVTIIVGIVGNSIFGIDAGVYSGIVAGLCVTVGKEYGDSLSESSNWNWNDVLLGCGGSFVGIIICIILYLLK